MLNADEAAAAILVFGFIKKTEEYNRTYSTP